MINEKSIKIPVKKQLDPEWIGKNIFQSAPPISFNQNQEQKGPSISFENAVELQTSIEET